MDRYKSDDKLFNNQAQQDLTNKDCDFALRKVMHLSLWNISRIITLPK